jgi:hypothetical protein
VNIAVLQAEMQALHHLIRENICDHVKGCEYMDNGSIGFAVRNTFVEVNIYKFPPLEAVFDRVKHKLEPKTRNGELNYNFWVELDHFRWTAPTIEEAFAKAKASVELIVSEFNATVYEIEQKQSQIRQLQWEIEQLQDSKTKEDDD